MADMHVLDGNNSLGWRVAFHLDVNGGTNAVGVLWRTALVNSGLGGTTDLPDGDGTAGTISAVEKGNIESGAVFEVIETIRAETGGTSNAELRATFRAAYAVADARESDRIGSVLRYFGHTETRA